MKNCHLFFGIEKDKTQKTDSGSNNSNGNSGLQMAQPTHISSRADYLGEHSRLSPNGNSAQKPTYPTFDKMYQQNPPIIPGPTQQAPVQEAMQNKMEPSAANEALGGGFGSAF